TVLGDHPRLDAAAGADVHHVHVRPLGRQRVPHRDHRVDMAARPAAGDEHAQSVALSTVRHPQLSSATVATSAEALAGGPLGTARAGSGAAARRRLMLSKMPMAPALTMSEEPP